MGDLLQQAISYHFRRTPATCIRQAVAVCRPSQAWALIRSPNAHGYWQLARGPGLEVVATRMAVLGRSNHGKGEHIPVGRFPAA